MMSGVLSSPQKRMSRMPATVTRSSSEAGTAFSRLGVHAAANRQKAMSTLVSARRNAVANADPIIPPVLAWHIVTGYDDGFHCDLRGIGRPAEALPILQSASIPSIIGFLYRAKRETQRRSSPRDA